MKHHEINLTLQIFAFSCHCSSEERLWAALNGLWKDLWSIGAKSYWYGPGPKQEAGDFLARVRNNISNCIPAEWITKPRNWMELVARKKQMKQNKTAKQHTLKDLKDWKVTVCYRLLLILRICRAASIGKDSLVSQGRAPAAQDITACGWLTGSPDLGVSWGVLGRFDRQCSKQSPSMSFRTSLPLQSSASLEDTSGCDFSPEKFLGPLASSHWFRCGHKMSHRSPSPTA